MEDKIHSAITRLVTSLYKNNNIEFSKLVDVTSLLPLKNFDYWERSIRCEYSTILRELSPSPWKLRTKSIGTLPWLDLISWDGYKREHALKNLNTPAPNAFFYTLLLRRLNDWVPQVREAAKIALLTISKTSDPTHVAEALSTTLPYWHSWKRIEQDHQSILFEIISQENIAKELINKLKYSPAGPMTSLFGQLGKTTILDKKLESLAKFAIQPSVRAKAYQSLFERKITWLKGREWQWTNHHYCEGRYIPVFSERKIQTNIPQLEILEDSSNDTSSFVRRISAELLIIHFEEFKETAHPLAIKFSSDTSLPVSERGNFIIKILKEHSHNP